MAVCLHGSCAVDKALHSARPHWITGGVLFGVEDLGHAGASVPVENHIGQVKIYSPILQVKQKGDVIFHLGSVIILVVSGHSAPLWWLIIAECPCTLCLVHLLALTSVIEMGSSPLLTKTIQIDFHCLFTQPLKPRALLPQNLAPDYTICSSQNEAICQNDDFNLFVFCHLLRFSMSYSAS